MTKLATRSKKAPPAHLDSVPVDPDPLFLVHIAKAAGVTRKEIAFEMRVSDTTVDNWFNRKLYDPLTRARDLVAFFRLKKALWVIPPTLEYVAGSDFAGRVLSPEENEHLRQLLKAVTK